MLLDRAANGQRRIDNRVRFCKVVSVRGKTPVVVARVDDRWSVRWNPHMQWRCSCPDEDCGHVDAVADLLDPEVTAGTDPTDDTSPVRCGARVPDDPPVPPHH